MFASLKKKKSHRPRTTREELMEDRQTHDDGDLHRMPRREDTFGDGVVIARERE